jgi:hypothetical protein
VEKLEFKNSIRTNRLKDLEANSSIRTNSDVKIQTKAENFTTEAKATMIIQTLGADENWLRWYCKIINTLSEATIQNILEGARKAQSPDRYFAKAASIELRKIS